MAEAARRIATLSELHTEVVEQVARVLRRELTPGTVERIDELLTPAACNLREVWECSKDASTPMDDIRQVGRQNVTAHAAVDQQERPHHNQAIIDAAQGDDEAEANKPTGPTSKREQRAQWLAQVMLLVRDHPNWSDAEIARRVDKHKSTLSRSKEYQAAAAMARGVKEDRHRGHISVDADSGLRDVEAYSDDPAERDWDT